MKFYQRNSCGLNNRILRLHKLVIRMAKNKQQLAGRFSVSLPQQLLADLDAMLVQKGYDNRSLAVADIARAWLVEQRRENPDQEIAGAITLVYDHHKRNLQEQLTDIQHDHHEVILATLHVHLDHHNCLEIIAVRGRAGTIQHIADALIGAKGVKHGKLTITSTGKDLAG
jgi:CopG family transcriptional regulator, nickel-responsive regulator